MTTPLRPADASEPDPDVPHIYVQPVDSAGQPLASPRLADPLFARQRLRTPLRKARQNAALAQLDTAEPLNWGHKPWDVVFGPGLCVVVQFASAWQDTGRTTVGHAAHEILPSGGRARDMSALALWTGSPVPDPGPAAGLRRDLTLPAVDPQQWDDRQRVSLDRARHAVLISGACGADPWLTALERDPEVWREAAATVLLEDDWEATDTAPARGSVAERFLRCLNREIKNWRDTWERQLNHRRVALMSEPLSGDRTVESLADETTDRHCTERAALDRLQVTDNPCVLKIMAKLTRHETRIADIYARSDLSWAKAAKLAEQEPQAGNTVAKKLRRLGKEHVSRTRSMRGAPPGPGCRHGAEATAPQA